MTRCLIKHSDNFTLLYFGLPRAFPLKQNWCPGSIPGLSMWNVWWTKWQWNRFSPSTWAFSCQSFYQCCRLIFIHLLSTLYDLDQTSSARSSRATCCPRHNVMLPAETFGTRTCPLTGAGPTYVGAPVRVIKWRLSNRYFSNLFSLGQGWPIFFSYVPKLRKFSVTFFRVWKPQFTSKIFPIIPVTS
jgi:hypothetical protein